MNVHPIRTKTDYRNSLAEIETLMDAGSGSPSGVRLDILATLVEAYEAAHFPVEAPDPIRSPSQNVGKRADRRR